MIVTLNGGRHLSSPSFLLPHRRSAWFRFVERLEELAAIADGVSTAVGADVGADVAAALRRAAANMTAQPDTTCRRTGVAMRLPLVAERLEPVINVGSSRPSTT
jgi:hypothetical protein